MSPINISRATFDKYQLNGKVALNSCYIQRIFEADGFPDHDGVVQIMKGRADHAALDAYKFCYRCRISDGVFQYNICISSDLEEQVEREKMYLNEGSIIAITGLVIVPSKDGQKPQMLVTGYTLLSSPQAVLLNDQAKAGTHPGEKNTHLNYHSNTVFDAVWPEAEAYCKEVRENQPPPAKVARTDNGPAPRKSAPPPPAATRKGSSNLASGVIPIDAVTPYMSNIKIHGMCSKKEEMRTIPAKNMKIFNFELTDAKGDCIRIGAFNEVAESMSSIIIENMSYYVTGGTVKLANKRFNNTGHDYEITLRNDSKVEPGAEVCATPKLIYKRIELNKIGSHIGELIDVIVVVEKMDENFTEFTSKQGKQLVKRELELVDESAVQARLTMWGEEAKNVSSDLIGKVVLFKGVGPREFNGSFSLSTGSSTRTIVCPEIPGVAELFAWYESERPNADIKSVSQMSGGSGEPPRTIAGITEMRFGNDSDKGDYATLKAMITRINPATALYKGCPNEGCQKKVMEDSGEYRCEKCQTTGHSFKWLFMIQFEISDETGQVYVTAFGDTAAKIVGKSAQEVGELKDSDERVYNGVFERLQFRPKLWRVRCKMETYNEEVKQRLTVFSVDDVNQDKYIQHLEQLVQQLEELPTN